MNAAVVRVRGANEGPLEGADLDLPLGQLVCLVGRDGAGARDLAHQVLYLESRRRYAQVLSAFERETLGGAGRAAVDQVSGVPPALYLDGALRQKQGLAGFLQLEARLGQLWRERGTSTCPDCGSPCRATTPEAAAEEAIRRFAGEPCLVLAPCILGPALLEELRRAGFLRVRSGGEVLRLDRQVPQEGAGEVVVDRLNADEAHRHRLVEACRQARALSRGLSLFAGAQGGREVFLNQRLSCLGCGRGFPDWSADASPPYSLVLGGCEWRDLAGKSLGEVLELLEAQQGCEGLCRPLAAARDLGLGHLPLGRPVEQLSTGEQQSLQLAWCLSLGLSGILYLFQAPSRGLDARGQAALAAGLLRLVAQGNTAVCLDHAPALLAAAGAVFECEGGKIREARAWSQPPPGERRPQAAGARWLRVREPGGEWHLPLGRLVCFAGPTGAGKSGLLHRVLLPGVQDRRGGPVAVEGRPGIQRAVALGSLGGAPGRTLLSQAGSFGGVAALYAETSAAREQGYPVEWFMLERPGGRCSTCEGAGVLSCDLDFCDDVSLVCPACEGRRYRPEALAFTWRGLNLSQVLDLRVALAAPHFRGVPQVGDTLHGLLACGLGHRRLGEAVGRLGPAEGLRLQLAGELRRAGPRELVVLEHPEGGGHPRDLEQLVQVLDGLCERGSSVWVETHHPALLRSADWIVEVGAGRMARSEARSFS